MNIIQIIPTPASAIMAKSLFSSHLGSLAPDFLSYRDWLHLGLGALGVIVLNDLLDDVLCFLHIPHSHVIEGCFHVSSFLFS
jgi:hypothetical protein